MSGFEIFTDSIANLSEKMATDAGIHVIPYIVSIDGREMPGYEEGTDMDETARRFYGDMRRGSVPVTSLINAERILAAVSPYVEKGSDVLVITCSSGISGTHLQALKACETVSLSRTKDSGEMRVCDSLNAGLGEGLLAVRAAGLRDMGLGLDEVVGRLNEARWEMNSLFTADDLCFLRRNGRISTPLAAVGTVLKIKPMLYADGDGKISLFAKAHGRRKAMERLIEETERRAVDLGRQTVAVTHCDCGTDAEWVANALREIGASDVVVQMYDICSGSHVGPGGLAVFFSGQDRRKKTRPSPATAEKGAVDVRGVRQNG